MFKEPMINGSEQKLYRDFPNRFKVLIATCSVIKSQVDSHLSII